MRHRNFSIRGGVHVTRAMRALVRSCGPERIEVALPSFLPSPLLKCLAFLTVLAIVSIARIAPAQSPWHQLESPELYAEACSARHLGWLIDNPDAEDFGIPSPLEMVDELLSRPSLPDQLYINAVRLKLLVLNDLGQFDASQAFLEGLPATLPLVSNRDWERQRALWGLMNLAASHQWDALSAGVADFPANPPLAGLSRWDYEYLKCLAMIRTGQTDEGHLQLARATAQSVNWGYSDAGFDPEAGFEETRHFSGWPVTKEVLRILSEEGAQSPLAQRRWLSIVFPPYDPRIQRFPEAPAEDAFALDEAFTKFRKESMPAPTELASMAGGFLELLAHTHRVYDYQYANMGRDIGTYVSNLPASIPRIPEELWSAFKLCWKIYGDSRLLRMDSIYAEQEEILHALEVVPSRWYSYLHIWIGYSRLRRFEPEAYSAFAKYFETRRSDDYIDARIHPQMLAGDPTPTLEQTEAVLEILGRRPNDPGALAIRSQFGIQRGLSLEGPDRNRILEQGISDGALALDILERDKKQIQAVRREELKPWLAQAIERVKGPEARERYLSQANLPVRGNPELVAFIPESRLAATTAESPQAVVARKGKFQQVVDQLADTDATEANAVVGKMSANDLREAVENLEGGIDSPAHHTAARALLKEANSRGAAALGIGAAEWAEVQVQAAELDLFIEEDFDRGVAMLEEISSRERPAGAEAADRARRKASVILDALNSVETPDAYGWSMKWLKWYDTAEHDAEPNLESMAYLRKRLGDGLKQALTRGDLLKFESESSYDPSVRRYNAYLAGYSLSHAAHYAEAEQVYERILAEPELESESLARVRSEQWRNYVWVRRAQQAGDPAEKERLCRQIVDFTLERFETLKHERHRREFALWGLWAARQLKDEQAAAVFEPLVQSE